MVTLDRHGLSKGGVERDETHQDLLTHWQILPDVLFNALKA